MNFYKDPLLEKLRLIESRILGEALSDEEFVDLQRLRAELADDPEVSKLHSEVDSVVKARATELEKPSGTSANTPADTPADSAASVEWPTTPEAIKAFQTAHPPLVADGKIGQKTMAALVAAGATPPAGFKPVGNKAKPTGKPPKGEAPQPTPASTNPEVAKIDAEIKRFTSGGNNMSLQANKDYVASLEKKKAALMAGSAAQPGTPPELSKTVPNPKEGQEHWVKGTRYEFSGGRWTITYNPGEFTMNGATRRAGSSGYTGPADWTSMNAGMANQTATGKPAAESTELDRLKSLLKF